MPVNKYATRNAILKYIYENQDKKDGETPLTIADKMRGKLGFAKSTTYAIISRMCKDKLVLREELDHVTDLNNKITIVRYYINPDNLKVVQDILSKM